MADGIRISVDKLLSDTDRAAGICGAISNDAVTARVEEKAGMVEVLRLSGPIESLPGARTATPMILKVRETDSDVHHQERFGPISFVIATKDIPAAIQCATSLAAERGAITAAVYATDSATLDAAANTFAAAGVGLSCNLTGGTFVNQSAAFSDYYVSGANPASNACMTNAAFVANRFRVAAVRWHKAA